MFTPEAFQTSDLHQINCASLIRGTANVTNSQVTGAEAAGPGPHSEHRCGEMGELDMTHLVRL